MARKLSRVGRLGGELGQRLRDLQANQAQKRGAAALMGEWHPREINAIKRMAREAFGDISSVHIDRGRPGVIQVGYFVEGPHPAGDAHRRRIVVFEGATHQEIVEQHRLWKSRL